VASAVSARCPRRLPDGTLWNKDKTQASVSVTITDTTLAALPEILNPAQPGYHDTAVESETVGALARPLWRDQLPCLLGGWRTRSGLGSFWGVYCLAACMASS
jgi:hypothetical protein